MRWFPAISYYKIQVESNSGAVLTGTFTTSLSLASTVTVTDVMVTVGFVGCD